MRSRWLALYRSLAWSINNPKVDEKFAAARVEKVLERFDSSDTLIAYLNAKGGDLDEKDRIYAVLVRAVQSWRDWSDLAILLLWLGLWPGLDAIHRRLLRSSAWTRAELVSEICWVFTDIVAHVDVTSVNRLASTIVFNVERDIRNTLGRQESDAGIVDSIGVGPAIKTSIEDRELPIDVENTGALREWLSEKIGEDADIVIGTVLLGFDLRETSCGLGMDYETIRKRYQRAIKCLRRRLKWLGR